LVAPFAARAQEAGRTYRIGFLVPAARQSPPTAAFYDELRLNGFVEGQNLVVTANGFAPPIERLAELATSIVKAAPDVIFAGGPPAARAVQLATRELSIVGISEDMVGERLVESLARPGGNMTGVSLLAPELDGKRQDLLMEASPGMRRMAALADSNVSTTQHLQSLKEAARERGADLSVFAVATVDEIGPAIEQAKASGAEMLNVLATPLLFSSRRLIIERVATLRLPAMYQWPEMAEEGGFAAYGPRITEIYRQVARLIVKVLRGTKPADLPVEQPTKFELVLNLTTAKAIGHEIPAGLVLRADKLIE